MSTSPATIRQGPSPSTDLSENDQTRYTVHLPHNLLVLPPTAAFVGLIIGMSRGGSRARLRFLAENAHRPPTTVQGWYFYTKTRNYRVFYAAATTGARYALGLGGAVGTYCILDESVGWIRERFERVGDRGRAQGWIKGRGVEGDESGAEATKTGGRHAGSGSDEEIHGRWSGWRRGPVHWEDGAFAGLLMGAGVGFAYTLPRPLFVRSLIMGTLLGGSTSILQVAQAKVAKLRDEEIRATALRDEQIEGAATNDVDRPMAPSTPLSGPPIDGTLTESVMPIASPSNETPFKRSGWFGWIPGLGK